MTPEQAAQRIAEALNGGEWRDGRWYTEGQRQAWIAAVTPVLEDAAREHKVSQTDTLRA